MIGTRRGFLRSVGAGAAGLGVLNGATGTAAAEHEYHRVPTDTDQPLFDVTDTSEGPFAVGAEGTFIRRGKERYHTVGNEYYDHFYAVDVTADGRYVWFVGEGGVVGEYDAVTAELTCHEVVDDDRPFVDVGVTGVPDDGTVYVLDAKGTLFYSFDYGGSWNREEFGHGAPTVALERFGERGGYVLDADGCLFRTVEGKTWKRYPVDDLEYYTFDLAGGPNHVGVVGENGLLYCREGEDVHYHKLSELDLFGVDYRTTDSFGVVVGFEGTLFEFDDGWRRVGTPLEVPLFDVFVGRHTVAVGEDGVVLERW
ncbi:MAG: WD40/YVTN/BNR-like repeat-containing protein [Halolamina sp.]